MDRLKSKLIVAVITFAMIFGAAGNALAQEKKQKKTKIWHIGDDDSGRTVLQWDTNSRLATETIPEDQDPLAQTFNLLKRLELPELTLESEPDGSTIDPPTVASCFGLNRPRTRSIQYTRHVSSRRIAPSSGASGSFVCFSRVGWSSFTPGVCL